MKPPNTGAKEPHNYSRGKDKTLCLGHRHRRLPKKSKQSALCASSRVISTFLHEPISRMLDWSEASHQVCHWRHHDTTTAPDGSSTLRMQHNMHPLSILRGATPPRLAIFNAGGDTPLHLLASVCSKMMLHRGRMAPRVTIVWSERPKYGVSPEQHHLQPTYAPKMMPSREATSGAAIIRSGSPGSRVSHGAARLKRWEQRRQYLHESKDIKRRRHRPPRPTSRIHWLPRHPNPSSVGSPPPGLGVGSQDPPH
jgi:hypothetical protein